MPKMIFLFNKPTNKTFEEFVSHHRGHHMPLFKSIPEAERYVRRYAVSHPLGGDTFSFVENEPQKAAAYDGVVEVWFDNMADCKSFFSSKNYLEKVRPDEYNFIDFDSLKILVTDEVIGIPGAA